MGSGQRLLLILVICAISLSGLNAQKEKRGPGIGFDFATGTQQAFPFNDPDYKYSIKGYKLQMFYLLSEKGSFSFEALFEPSLYFARHELLNEYFVKPDEYPEYEALRIEYSKEKTIREYAFNIGILIRLFLNDKVSLFFLGSVGPMFSDTRTERMARGFAFSDIAAIGAGFHAKNFLFELRPGVRHVSNANIQWPNSGYNSLTLDFGISYLLLKSD